MFEIIYADPPWPENATVGTPRSGADRHFETMSVEQICKVPVAQLATEDALLMLWTTGRHVPAAVQVMDAWDFEWVGALFVWEKVTQDRKSPICTLGFYTNNNTEFCWLGRRKKQKGTPRPPALKPARADIIAEIREPRPGALAKKPEEARRRIELMYPTQRKVELFGRREVPGWTVLGDGIDGRDISAAIWDLVFGE